MEQEIEQEIKSANIAGLARIIIRDWRNVNYAAAPYLRAMRDLHDMKSMYGHDDARSIVLYFLANAGGWRGDVAKAVKAELKARIS